MKIVRSDCQLGESPIYDTKNNSIYWLDLNLAFLHKYDLRKKNIQNLKSINTHWVVYSKLIKEGLFYPLIVEYIF